MAKDLSFEWMDKDKVCSRVQVKNGRVICEQISTFPEDYIFWKGEPTIERLLLFFASRCFSEGRPDKDEYLEALGLKEYSPLDICRVTHGRMTGDSMWIRFEGEDLTFADVL